MALRAASRTADPVSALRRLGHPGSPAVPLRMRQFSPSHLRIHGACKWRESSPTTFGYRRLYTFRTSVLRSIQTTQQVENLEGEHQVSASQRAKEIPH